LTTDDTVKEAEAATAKARSGLLRRFARLVVPTGKGKGINSIPVRFALMTGIFAGMAFLAYHLSHDYLHEIGGWPIMLAAALAAIILPAAITYLAASQLAFAVEALRSSTEAVINGDLNAPVDVDCPCEVGGLADSFRAMIDRLNSNIVRMNVLAYSDPVTGLANRAVVQHVLRKVSDIETCTGSVLFIDLDNFKKVNDTLGHKAGDDLLKDVADRIIEEGFGLTRDDIDNCTTAFGDLCTTCPEKPVLARFAGDEYVAFLPGETENTALGLRAQNVIDAIARPFTIDGTEVSLSASVGIARMPDDTDHPEHLLSYADLAMYAAKEGGKNRYAFFDRPLMELAVERNQVEEELRKAIENDDLSLHFQPKLCVDTMHIEGVEALVRWNHAERGRIPPDKFIDIAEQRGLMPDLGATVLRLAVRQAAKWRDAGMPLPVAINVSAAQFEQPNLVPCILGALEEYALEPSLIEIEITETMVMSDFVRTQNRMRLLRQAGVQISIDDFGTGFSNLSQLSRLPFSVLKVDKSLIADIGHNPKSEAIIRAIVSMAHALGHKVVAEGIEEVGQYDFVRRLGCNLAQGHLFGRAMSADDLEIWIDTLGRSEVLGLQEEIRERLAVS
jgi:two-component system CheB/CheR fusion protein